ncbi:MAG: hypothetical protein FF85_04090 [alpha proteobacterium QL1]|nr:MAG: hypothetical protein FF85_04090 [alpha proteobacterium QL1]
MNIQLSFTDEVKTNTSQIYNKIKDTVPDVEWPLLAPYIYEINKLKKKLTQLFLPTIIKRLKFFME